MQFRKWSERCRNFGLSARSGLGILLLNVLATVMEALGVSIFLPIFQFIRVGGDIAVLTAESPLWGRVVHIFGELGLRINLATLLGLAFFFFAVRQIGLYARVVVFQTVMEGMIKKVRDRTFRYYLESDTSYQDNMPVGDLVNVMTTETREAVIAVLTPILFLSTNFIIVVYLFILGSLSLTMTIVAVIVLGAASYGTKIWMMQSVQTGRSLTAANTRTSTFLVGRLKSPRLVRLSGTELAEQHEMGQLTDAQRKESIHLGRMTARVDIVLEPVVIALSCTFLYLAVTVFKMNIEEIGLYLVVALRLLPVVRELVRQWQGMQRGLGPIEIVERRMVQMAGAREVDDGKENIGRLTRALEVRNVWFAYPGREKKVLSDLSFDLKANTVTALVGPSGAGKSTFIDLLPKLRRASRGVLLFDGVAIENIGLTSLRRQIAYAPQSPQIFPGTIGQHIRYGNPGATFEEMCHAATLAGAHDFIARLPDGYDTKIGDGAVELSAGQRQRLDLARALVSQSSILIMDEPTSNLDAESEAAFRISLKRIKDEDRITVIVVAHRLSNISDADQIVVLRDGKVDAAGTHAELIGAGGWYASAYRSQMEHSPAA